MKHNTQFFLCDCGAEAIGIESWDWGDGTSEVCMSFWSWGHNRFYDWKYRLSHIWQIIRRGHPWVDSVILNPEQARELGQKLIEMAEG